MRWSVGRLRTNKRISKFDGDEDVALDDW